MVSLATIPLAKLDFNSVDKFYMMRHSTFCYIYIYVCVCVYIYIYIYIFAWSCKNKWSLECFLTLKDAIDKSIQKVSLQPLDPQSNNSALPIPLLACHPNISQELELPTFKIFYFKVKSVQCFLEDMIQEDKNYLHPWVYEAKTEDN